MITIDGETFPTHKEYFNMYPYKQKLNKKDNIPLLMQRYMEPCPDCKLKWHPAVMTLDHVNRDGYHTHNGRRVSPSEMLGYPTSLFQSELSKCEAVCSNCHKIREMVRDGITKTNKWRSYGESAIL